MDAVQYDLFGQIQECFSFIDFVPKKPKPRKLYFSPKAFVPPSIPYASLVKDAPRASDAIVSDGRYFFCKGRLYTGDVSFEDYTDPSIKYRKKVKIFGPGYFKTYISRDPIFRMPYAKAHRDRPSLTEEERAEIAEQRREDKRLLVAEMTSEELDAYHQRKAAESMSRAKTRLLEHILMNKYNYFVTLTFDDEKVDGKDLPAVIKKLHKWLDNMVIRKGLQYLLVPEYHPSSGRIHLHALMNDALSVVDSGTRMIRGFNKPVRLENYWRMVNEGRLDSGRCRILRSVFNVEEWRYGFSTAIETYGSKLALAHYMTKYVTKGNNKIFGKHFWSSKNQVKYPVTELRAVFENAYWESTGIRYSFAGMDMKIEDHVVISCVSNREKRMLDQVALIMTADGEVYEDVVV